MVGRIRLPKDAYILNAGTCEYTLTWQKEIADVIELRT